MSSFLDNLRYPIISTLRKGTVDDPFIFKQDRHIVQNNNIYLQEIPDSFNLFTISNPDIPTEVYTRITIGYPQNTFEYIVDYIFDARLSSIDDGKMNHRKINKWLEKCNINLSISKKEYDLSIESLKCKLIESGIF